MKFSKLLKGSVAAAIGVSLTTGICAIAFAADPATTTTDPLDTFDATTPGDAAKATVAFDGVDHEQKDTVTLGSWMHYAVNPLMIVPGVTYGYDWSIAEGWPMMNVNGTDALTPLAFNGTNKDSYKNESEIALKMEAKGEYQLKMKSGLFKSNGDDFCAPTQNPGAYTIIVVDRPTVDWQTALTAQTFCYDDYIVKDASGKDQSVNVAVPDLKLGGFGPWKVYYTVTAYTGDNVLIKEYAEAATDLIGNRLDKSGLTNVAFNVPKENFEIGGSEFITNNLAAKKGVRFDVTVTRVTDRFSRKALNSEELSKLTSMPAQDKRFQVLIFPSSQYSLPVIHVKNQ